MGRRKLRKGVFFLWEVRRRLGLIFGKKESRKGGICNFVFLMKFGGECLGSEVLLFFYRTLERCFSFFFISSFSWDGSWIGKRKVGVVYSYF